MSPASPRSPGSTAVAVLAMLLAIVLIVVPGLPPDAARGETVPDHLVISELVTGGASASDELIELYNPTASALPLEGLELVYVTASGATISRRAAWELGAPVLEPGRHFLVANELGTFAPIADAVYASGMAATGGSVALRIQGASTAVDAVGWGTAASAWLEGQVAAAPPPGSSLERLPGGASGSTQDTQDNATDFVVRAVPEPQNLGSAPVPDPATTPLPSPVPSPVPSLVPSDPPTSTTPAPTDSASPAPSADVVPVAAARALPDGTVATVEGVALTGATFTDGGGYLADAGAGIAVIVTGSAFERGDRLRLTGVIDDRFSQRTIRVEALDLVRLGTAEEPTPIATGTGAIGEAVEGRLVRVAGSIVGSASTLTTGVAFDLDDGSGGVRLVVATSTGIDTSTWRSGTTLDLVGVVGQRDSTGTGTTGYRVQPRDPADIRAVGAPDASASATPDPSPSSSSAAGTVSIRDARALPKNARARVRGTVTLMPGIVDPTAAVIQDGTAAIVIRVGEELGPIPQGALIEVDGVRSTMSGMETLRVTTAPRRLGSGTDPTARELRTGDAAEAVEAQLIVVRGAVLSGLRRASTGSVSFEVDDGSGPLRVFAAGPIGFDGSSLTPGTWVEIVGVLGQDTTGAQPLRGYRVWPRQASEVRIVAATTGGATGSGSDTSESTADSAHSGLDTVGIHADADLRVGATLVSGPWPELGLGGLLWDGVRLAGLEPAAGTEVERVLAGRRAPMAVELTGPRASGFGAELGLPLLRVGSAHGAIRAGAGPVAPPSVALPDENDGPRWVALVGRARGAGGRLRLEVRTRIVDLEVRCMGGDDLPRGVVAVVGIATAGSSRIVVPCGGIRPTPRLPAGDLVEASRDRSAATTRPAALTGAEAGHASPIGPAVLLGLAALGLLGGAIAIRRFEPSEPDPSDEDGSAPDSGDTASSPPALTLVPVPRERAP